MVKHCHEGEAWWCLPGGRIEADETPEQAALRELWGGVPCTGYSDPPDICRYFCP